MEHVVDGTNLDDLEDIRHCSKAAAEESVKSPLLEAKITKDDIILEGIDIDEVSQSAANIRRKTKIKNKDPRVFQDGIYVYKKGVI